MIGETNIPAVHSGVVLVRTRTRESSRRTVCSTHPSDDKISGLARKNGRARKLQVEQSSTQSSKTSTKTYTCPFVRGCAEPMSRLPSSGCVRPPLPPVCQKFLKKWRIERQLTRSTNNSATNAPYNLTNLSSDDDRAHRHHRAVTMKAVEAFRRID